MHVHWSRHMNKKVKPSHTLLQSEKGKLQNCGPDKQGESQNRLMSGRIYLNSTLVNAVLLLCSSSTSDH